MPSWNLQKLITLFLILAVGTTSLILVFPDLMSRNAQIAVSPAEQTALVPPQNAFSDSAGFAASNGQVPPSLSPDDKEQNLTNDLSQALTQSLIDANPNGPQAANGTGTATLAVPDAASLNQNLVQTLADANLVDSPNFGESVSDSKLKIVGDSKENKASYAIAINNILGDTILGANFTNILEETPDADTVASAQSILAGAASSVQATAVPVSLVPFQKSLLTLLADRKKFVDIAASTQGDDPLKSLIMVQKTASQIDAVLNRDDQNFISELKKAGFQTISQNSGPSKNFLAKIFDSLLGIEKAEAIVLVPVGDILNKPEQIGTQVATHATWLRMLWEWAQKVLLQQLQNMLVRLVEQRVLGWVQGSGAPKFVTNWSRYLVNSFNQGANLATAQIVPGLDPSFNNLVNSALQPPGTTIKSDISKYTNPTQFYQNFANGNWTAFGALLKPDNNFFGALLDAHDIQLAKAAQAQQAAQSKAVASQGFTGTGPGANSNGSQCTNPVPTSEGYDLSHTQTDAINDLNNTLNAQVSAGYIVMQPITCTPSGDGEQGTCSMTTCAQSDFQEQITTPGVTVAHALDNALDLSGKNVTAAKDIIGLVSAVIDSAINSLVRMGESGLVSVFQSPPPSTSGATLSGSICSGLSGTALTNCQNSATTANQTASQASNPPPAETVPSTSTPAVVITSPAASSTVSGTVTITASAPDSGVSTSKLLSIQFLVDGNPAGDVLYSAPYSISWDTTAVSNGIHQIAALITTVSNATGTTGLTTVVVSNNFSTGSSSQTPSPCQGLSGAALTSCENSTGNNAGQP